MSGIYIQVEPQTVTKNIIRDILNTIVQKDRGIKLLPPKEYHVTVIYSRANSDRYKPENSKYAARILRVEKWDGTSEGDIAVAILGSPKLTTYHTALRKEHGFTFDYDKYTPHITLMSGRITPTLLKALNTQLTGIHMLLTNERSEPLDEDIPDVA